MHGHDATQQMQEALRLLRKSASDCENDAFPQLQKDIMESTRMITEVIRITDLRSLGREDIDILREYIARIDDLGEMLRQKRNSVRDNLRELDNADKLNHCYLVDD